MGRHLAPLAAHADIAEDADLGGLNRTVEAPAAHEGVRVDAVREWASAEAAQQAARHLAVVLAEAVAEEVHLNVGEAVARVKDDALGLGRGDDARIEIGLKRVGCARVAGAPIGDLIVHHDADNGELGVTRTLPFLANELPEGTEAAGLEGIQPRGASREPGHTAPLVWNRQAEGSGGGIEGHLLVLGVIPPAAIPVEARGRTGPPCVEVELNWHAGFHGSLNRLREPLADGLGRPVGDGESGLNREGPDLIGARDHGPDLGKTLRREPAADRGPKAHGLHQTGVAGVALDVLVEEGLRQAQRPVGEVANPDLERAVSVRQIEEGGRGARAVVAPAAEGDVPAIHGDDIGGRLAVPGAELSELEREELARLGSDGELQLRAALDSHATQRHRPVTELPGEVAESDARRAVIPAEYNVVGKAAFSSGCGEQHEQVHSPSTSEMMSSNLSSTSIWA